MAQRNSRQRNRKKQQQRKSRAASPLDQINMNAAGIDVGATSHWVAVPEDRDEQPVREFGAFTSNLYALADWLGQCGVETVVMESTGVYWIPLFQVLEERGFEVLLVDPRRLKHVPGRKTDVLDCQWLQQLHTFGLLAGAFRPEDKICVLRSYLRQRSMLVTYASYHIQHMQKALTQMNVKLQHVVSDITGVTGMRIIDHILKGQRDPVALAKLRDPRCKNDEETIALALRGHWRDEHLFELRQAVELYRIYHQKVTECDEKIEKHLDTFDDKSNARPLGSKQRRRQKGRYTPVFDLRASLHRMTGVDLTKINGIDSITALKVISEIGLDMSRWPTVKHFASWLSLCPGSKKSEGKILSSRTKASANRAAAALRLAVQTLHRSNTALGAYFRRMKARLGAPQATTAAAHKLARLIYSMLRFGTEYVDMGQDYYEHQYRQRALRNLKRRARQFGYNLTQIIDLPPDPHTA